MAMLRYFPREGSPVLYAIHKPVMTVGRALGNDVPIPDRSVKEHHAQIVFNGRDEVLSAGLLMGAGGGIGSIYNIKPAWFVELYRHARASRWAEARQVQDRINDLIRILLEFPFMSALKQVMTWEGIDCGLALRPRRPISLQQRSDLKNALASLI